MLKILKTHGFIALYAAWVLFEALAYDHRQGDFQTFYFAPKLAFEEGRSLYDSDALRSATAEAGIPQVSPWLYPPSKAVLLRPLSWLRYDTAKAALFGVNLALALYLPWMMLVRLRLHGGNGRLALAVTLLLPFASMLHDNLHYGNLSMFALWGALLAWDAARRRSTAEGGWLAMATWFKLYPVALMASAFLGRRWKALAAGIAILAAIEGLSLAVLPASDLLAFVADVAPRGAYGETPAGIIKPWAAGNQGIGGVLSRLLISHGSYRAILDAPGAVKPLSYAFCIVVMVVTSAAALRRRGKDAVDLGYASFLCAMFLVAPLAWHSFGMMVIPAAVVMAAREMERRPVPLYAILAWALVALPIEPRPLWRAFGLRAAMVMCSTQFVGVMLLWIATIRASGPAMFHMKHPR